MKDSDILIASLEGELILLREENAQLNLYVEILKERIRSMCKTTQAKPIESGFDCP